MRLLVILFISVPLFGEKASVKVEGVDTDRDTSITIQKGKPRKDCTAYQVLDGHDEVFGGPEYDKSKALASWKTSCQEWKQSFKDLNKENRIITMNCNQPAQTKDGDQFLYKSSASYRVRVKVQEPGGE